MQELLSRFNGDIHTKEALVAFILQVIDAEGLKKIYSGQDVSAIKEAHDLILKAFEELDEQFGIKTAKTANPESSR